MFCSDIQVLKVERRNRSSCVASVTCMLRAIFQIKILKKNETEIIIGIFQRALDLK